MRKLALIAASLLVISTSAAHAQDSDRAELEALLARRKAAIEEIQKECQRWDLATAARKGLTERDRILAIISRRDRDRPRDPYESRLKEYEARLECANARLSFGDWETVADLWIRQQEQAEKRLPLY